MILLWVRILIICFYKYFFPLFFIYYLYFSNFYLIISYYRSFRINYNKYWKKMIIKFIYNWNIVRFFGWFWTNKRNKNYYYNKDEKKKISNDNILIEYFTIDHIFSCPHLQSLCSSLHVSSSILQALKNDCNTVTLSLQYLRLTEFYSLIQLFYFNWLLQLNITYINI